MADRKNHKYISKHVGPSGKTVYVYDNKPSKKKSSSGGLGTKIRLATKIAKNVYNIQSGKVRREAHTFKSLKKNQKSFMKSSKELVSIGESYIKRINMQQSISTVASSLGRN